MYIKILVYVIDNQQVEYKISILFSVCRSFAVLVSRPSWIGGGWSKNGSPAGPISGRWSVPYIPHIPAIPYTSTCDAHPAYPTYPYMSVIPTYPKFYYICDIIKI